MSNACFCMYRMGLLLVWVVVITTASPVAQESGAIAKLWVKNQKQEKHLERKCKALCQQCDCMGFYCGEECLCEYDKRARHRGGSYTRKNSSCYIHTDSECIASMQRSASTESMPFDILIQGPSNDLFVRTASKFASDKKHNVTVIDAHNKRTTMLIYHPYAPAQTHTLTPTDKSSKEASLATSRHRRSVAQLDWFSDFANTLVRPAPLRNGDGNNKKREISQNKEGSAPENPESWFTDHVNVLVRPAPLPRRQSLKKQDNHEKNDDAQNASMLAVEHVLKNTIRNIQDSHLGAGLRTSLRDGANLLQGAFQGAHGELFPKGLRNPFTASFDGEKNSRSYSEHGSHLPPTLPRPAQPILLPWFRPLRFLRRVQQAIN